MGGHSCFPTWTSKQMYSKFLRVLLDFWLTIERIPQQQERILRDPTKEDSMRPHEKRILKDLTKRGSGETPWKEDPARSHEKNIRESEDSIQIQMGRQPMAGRGGCTGRSHKLTKASVPHKTGEVGACNTLSPTTETMHARSDCPRSNWCCQSQLILQRFSLKIKSQQEQ